jgi:hypothetical protein
VIGVGRGRPVLRPGTVNTIGGPVGMPSFCMLIMSLFTAFFSPTVGANLTSLVLLSSS